VHSQNLEEMIRDADVHNTRIKFYSINCKLVLPEDLLDLQPTASEDTKMKENDEPVVRKMAVIDIIIR
jgi:hypothetical protein